MKIGKRAAQLLFTAAAALSLGVLAAGPAAAADDSFNVPTTNGCGEADFVDYGPGAPGGGTTTTT